MGLRNPSPADRCEEPVAAQSSSPKLALVRSLRSSQINQRPRHQRLASDRFARRWFGGNACARYCYLTGLPAYAHELMQQRGRRISCAPRRRYANKPGLLSGARDDQDNYLVAPVRQVGEQLCTRARVAQPEPAPTTTSAGIAQRDASALVGASQTLQFSIGPPAAQLCFCFSTTPSRALHKPKVACCSSAAFIKVAESSLGDRASTQASE